MTGITQPESSLQRSDASSRPRRARHPAFALAIHLLRVGLVAALLLLIPSPASQSISDGSLPPTLESVQEVFPNATLVDPQQNAAGMWSVTDREGNVIGSVARTLPAARKVVGYRGPSEALIAFDSELRIVGVRLLQSSDTEEHVKAVVADQSFFEQFADWPWGGPTVDTEVDAVSGATLTSLALVVGVLKRIGDDPPTLVFPDPLSVDEVQSWVEQAASVDNSDALATVKDRDGHEVGHLLRTGPLTDDIIGYQGPTELLIQLSRQQMVEKIRLRKSYDNEQYVDYVRQEAGFWATFEGRSLSELAEFDPQAAGVEGVSGATMTSLAVADTVVAAAQAATKDGRADHKGVESSFAVRWGAADLGTIAALLLTAVLSRLRLFHVRMFRRLWLVFVLVVIGLWSGNLVSMALIVGWSAEGVPWRLAPVLSAITAVALLAPPLTKGNPYCNHLCPHGAIQQWIRPGRKARRHFHPSPAAMRWLSRLPGITLVLAYLALLAIPTIDLSSWEPFHAYLFRIAGTGSLMLAAFSLLLAAAVPMAYCRFGCPTGRLIDYLRRSAASHRIQKADLVAAGLLIVAMITRISSQ